MAIGTLTVSTIDGSNTSLKISWDRQGILNPGDGQPAYKVVQVFRADELSNTDFNFSKAPATAMGYNYGTAASYPVTSFINYSHTDVTSVITTIKSQYPSDWNSATRDAIIFRIYKWLVFNTIYKYDVNETGNAVGNWKFVNETLALDGEGERGGDCEDTSNLFASLVYAALMDPTREVPLTANDINQFIRVVVGFVDFDLDHLWNDGHAWVVYKTLSNEWRIVETTYHTTSVTNFAQRFPYSDDVSGFPLMNVSLDQYAPLFCYRAKLAGEDVYDGIFAIDTAYDPNNDFGIWGENKDTNEYAIFQSTLYDGSMVFDIGGNVYHNWATYFDPFVHGAGDYQYGYRIVPKRYSTLRGITNVESSTNGITWAPVSDYSFDLLNQFVALKINYPYVRVAAEFNSLTDDLIESYVSVSDDSLFFEFIDSGLEPGNSYYYRHKAYSEYMPRGGTVEGPSAMVLGQPAAPDVDAPPNVVNFKVTAGIGKNVLSWINPSAPSLLELDGLIIRYRESEDLGNGSPPVSVVQGLPLTQIDDPIPGQYMTYIHESLDSDIRYDYTIFTFDNVPNYSSGASAWGIPTVLPDEEDPDPVTILIADAGDLYVDLAWGAPDVGLPNNQDIAGYRISISYDSGLTYGIKTGDPLEFIDEESGGYISITNPFSTSFRVGGSVEPGSLYPLENGTTYWFKIIVVDVSNNLSTEVTTSATPVSSTDAPKSPPLMYRNPTADSTPSLYFGFVDTAPPPPDPADYMNGYELILSNVPDFSTEIIHENITTGFNEAGGVSAISGLLDWNWIGFPPAAVPSGLSATWYLHTISNTLSAGSYFLKLRTFDSSGKYSPYTISSFTVDTSVTGVQVLISSGDIVNNRLIDIELRAPEDVTEYMLSIDPGFNDVESFLPFHATEEPQQHVVEIDITGSGFVPGDITINKGDKVIWNNLTNRNVVVASGRVVNYRKEPDGLFNSGDIVSGRSFEYVFDDAGTIYYYDDLLPDKSGSVEVMGYENSMHITYSIPGNSRTVTLYARFKDRLGNETDDAIMAIVVLELPDIISPNNTIIQTTLPIMEWKVPKSANGHKNHFRLQVSKNDPSISETSFTNGIVYESSTADNPELFRYRYEIDNVWYPFPISGLEYSEAPENKVVRFIVPDQTEEEIPYIQPDTRYYWRVWLGT